MESIERVPFAGLMVRQAYHEEKPRSGDLSLRQFKVLTFDVVGTLIDFEGGMIAYIRKTSGLAPERLADDRILESYRRVRAGSDRMRYPDTLVPVYRAMADELGLPTTAGLAESFRDSIEGWPAFPDSVAALKRLKARYRLMAMTNAQRWALTHMAKTLGNPFDDSVTVDDALCEKPDPKFFAFARGRLSVAGHRLGDILHVAQSQYHDIGVAKSLGYKTCWIQRRKRLGGWGGSPVPAEVAEPDWHFATLAELADAAEAAG
jgi:putative hydrolase of the HAD superfamily